jgi:hypothetical protein
MRGRFVPYVKETKHRRPLLNETSPGREDAMTRPGLLVRSIEPCAVAAVFGFLSTLLVGCVTTFSAEPLGETIANLKPDEWNGLWMDKQGDLARVRVVDSAGGKLLLIQDWKDCSARTTSSDTDRVVQLRQSGSWYFENPKKKKEVLYEVWLAFHRDREALFMCVADDERVRELVVSGALPGFVYEGDVVIWPLSRDQYSVLLSDSRPAFRAVDVFMRLPGELDPCRKTD